MGIDTVAGAGNSVIAWLRVCLESGTWIPPLKVFAIAFTKSFRLSAGRQVGGWQMIIYNILSQTQAEFKHLDEKFGFLSVLGCFSKAGKAVLRQEFNLVYANLLSVCADSRFAKPRSSLKKGLIVAVRSCGCGALNRGWQNLGASLKGF